MAVKVLVKVEPALDVHACLRLDVSMSEERSGSFKSGLSLRDFQADCMQPTAPRILRFWAAGFEQRAYESATLSCVDYKESR